VTTIDIVGKDGGGLLCPFRGGSWVPV